MDLFRTTHTVKIQRVVRNRGQRCGDIEIVSYLVNEEGPVSLVMDLHITHDRWGSTSDPSINGHLHYPNDIDRSLNEDASDKIRKYRPDYYNNPPSSVAFMSTIVSTSGRLHSEFVCLLFLQNHRETDRFFAVSGVQLVKSTSGLYHYKRVSFSSQLRDKVGNILTKDTTLRITLNVDDTPVVSRSHTHPSHSQTVRLLTSSMSLGITVPHVT